MSTETEFDKARLAAPAFAIGDRVRCTEDNELMGVTAGMEGVTVQAKTTPFGYAVEGKPYDTDGFVAVIYDNPGNDLFGQLLPDSIRYTSAHRLEKV